MGSKDWEMVSVKLRMKFKKEGLTRFISHLDTMRTFERAFRRANLPIAFTQGFNPRPKITFAQALSVGVTSSSEYMDVEFYEDVSVDDVAFKLNQVLPEGIKILDVKVADEKLALSMLNGATYIVTVVLGEVALEELKKCLKCLLQHEEIIIEKKTKSGKKLVNIAPLIYNLDLADNCGDTAKIAMSLSMGQQGNVAPMTVIQQLESILEKNLQVVSIHRGEMFYKTGDKKISPFNLAEK